MNFKFEHEENAFELCVEKSVIFRLYFNSQMQQCFIKFILLLSNQRLM